MVTFAQRKAVTGLLETRDLAGPVLHVRVLGEPSLRFGSEPVRTVNRKMLCMLGYLALSQGLRESRERLVGLLWSESDEKRARGSLRQVMTAFRRLSGELDFDGFDTDRAHVALDPARIKVDVDAVLARLGPEDLHPALLEVEDLPATLLQGCEDVDPAFSSWLSVQRQALRERILRGLLSSLERTWRESRSCREVARAILRIDPTQEIAARRLMESLSRTGDVAGALNVYNALWQVLEDEHDMEPAQATQDVLTAIKSGVAPLGPDPAAPPSGPAGHPSGPTPGAATGQAGAGQAGTGQAGAGQGATGRSVTGQAAAGRAAARQGARGVSSGVGAASTALAAGGQGAAAPAARRAPMRLPPLLIIGRFELNGENADARLMLDGFRHALIGSLVRFREWQVAESDAPVATADGPDAPARNRFRIRATAEPFADGLRVALTICEHDSGIYVWSDDFDLDYRSWAERQSTLLRQVTIALNVNLSADRLRRTVSAPEITASLYDLWLRGQSLILRFDSEGWEEASRLLNEVNRLAPDFAPGVSSCVQLGNTAHISRPGRFRSAEMHRRTLEMAQRAVALDPLDSRAQLALGWALAFNHRWEHALTNFELALQLNSHDPWTMTSIAQARAVAGECGSAQKLAAAALESAPLPNHSRWGYHASIRFFCGDDQGALHAARIAGDTHPNNGGWRAAALAHMGRTDEARAEARALVALVSGRWVGRAPPTPRNVARWVLQVFPYRQEAEWKRLRDGLRMAGLPVSKLRMKDVEA